MNSNREKITNIVMVGVFAAVLAVLSQISFPLPSGIPVTLQTFAVALCGYALGCKRGTLAVLVYIVLGTVGLPVFANFSGGFGSLGRSRGGYIYGFLPMGCAVRPRHKNAAPCARHCTRCCGSCGLPSVRHDSVRHYLRQRPVGGVPCGLCAVSRQGHRLRCGGLRRSDRPQFRTEEERHSHRSVKAFSQSVWNKIETEKAVCKGKSRAGRSFALTSIQHCAILNFQGSIRAQYTIKEAVPWMFG